ncbi:MAG: TonB-dependent receptor [Ignavibacteria bacterium]|nr:TonB-dependent receptor [Ignavibacteria bacterium]MBT8382378.1 TonB-dependent receptor [Ignavibacteria bacterium]MBT8391836.1 TonB-dependent receptor [Ignavibacteria bacterium]NNJ51897.1 TonB-dependent receptor [Ignavibacteriaceae bacterium]NNL21105.1 TonB-dependent receptor [Ignavibacteriaceae bacterium]
MRYLLCFTFFAIQFNVAIGQTLTGRVYEKDNNENKIPLIGTNIYWLGTQTGTTSDEEGYFELEKVDPEKLSLVISYIGYQPDTVQVPINQDSIEITLSVNRELKEVVVTGTSLSKFIDELDAKPTEIITSKELLKAACCNLSESFTTNASVDIQFQDAVTGAKQIQLLGLAGTYTQILFENIPTLNGIANTFGLGYVPGPWMTSISISKGAASVVNGYESITGQINIDYKKPDDIERFYFNAFQSSHFKTDLNANASVHLNENLSSMLLAHTDFNVKALDDNGDSFADQPKVKQFNFLNRWKYESFNGFRSQFGIQILNEERRGGQVTTGGQGRRYEINIDSKHIEMFAKNGFVFSDEPYTSLGLILNGHIHEQNSLFGLRQYNAEQNSFYSNLLFETRTEDEIHSLTLGGSYVFDQYKEEFDSLNFFRKESRPGLFVEYNFSPSNLLSIVPGARVDFHNLYGTFFTPRMHVKYRFDDNTTIRLSAGKGIRSVNLISDNLKYLASSRNFVVVDRPTYEEGWNYGFNLTRYFSIDDREMRITLDFYRTDFVKQTVVDIDTDVRQVRFYNLNGKSYSNNYQIELAYQLIPRLDISAAFRYSDVKTQYDKQFLIKPLLSKYKFLITASYVNEHRDWFFDTSFLLNGNGRIPSTQQNPVEYQRPESFSSFININAQVTKKINIVDLYLGVENLLNYRQVSPIIAADDPFGEYFDASLVWGPIEGRRFYAGVRLSIL